MIAGKSSSLLTLQKGNGLSTPGKLTGSDGVCFFCSDRKLVDKEDIDTSSKGGCVQQATGWRKGTGLGYGHPGLASSEEAEGRMRGPSVGAPGRTSKRQSNETYRDAVRRVMFARYKELD
ncbi:RBM6 isoform 20 [Pongo abelii]|uniref:RBM6 isoform 20 n=1 Tax=Pongo abelii TaxID=9601 RepID=A0A2J8TH43_PONAB|nr:RBM6 isoform 20 [Pongo abelii]